jgi:D-glycero-D-manno-heptose 1,7-bisphosphate phosphatase
MNKILFLDRDGVINVEKNYLHKIEDFEFIDGVFEACRYYQDRGYKIIVVTNQSGIGRGYYTHADFAKLTDWMISEFQAKGVDILDVFYCPHTPTDECECRKPRIGMIDKANNLYDVDYKNSIIVGDKESDIGMGVNAGLGTKILVKSGHKVDESATKADFVMDSIKDIITLKVN